MALPKRPTPLKLKGSPSQSASSQCLNWSNEEVVRWLGQVNDGLFAAYAQQAVELDINGQQLVNLTANDLRARFGLTQTNHVTTLLAAIQRLNRKSRDRRRRRSLGCKTPEPQRRGKSPIPHMPDLELDDIPWPAERKEQLKSMKFAPLTNSRSVPSNANTAAVANATETAVVAEQKIDFSPKSKVPRRSTMARGARTPEVKARSHPKHQKMMTASLSKASKTATSTRSQRTHKKARSMVSRSALKRSETLGSKSDHAYGKSDQGKLRAYTVAMNGDDEKLDTAQLKRMLTQQNVHSSKKKNHKDMGKKLWPSETSTILKEGWMKKRGAKITAFKERWCVLRESGHLYYFEKRPVKTTDLPQGFLDLNAALKVEYVEDNHPNTFKLSTKDRDWIFSCMSGSELVQWMSHLNKTMLRLTK